MSIDKDLSSRRTAIIKKWQALIIGTYPSETQRFFKKEKDRFSNPVGQTIEKDIVMLYDALVKGEDVDRIHSSLDNIIRIRAIQDFRPSQAIGFVLGLKQIIKKELGHKDRPSDKHFDLEALESRIDDAALMAVDIYTECRQKLYELRVNEIKNQVGGLLRKANIASEISGFDPVP